MHYLHIYVFTYVHVYIITHLSIFLIIDIIIDTTVKNPKINAELSINISRVKIINHVFVHEFMYEVPKFR